MTKTFIIYGKEDQNYTVGATFMVDGHEVEFTSCTAIATSCGETKRTNAIFVHDNEDEFGDGDGVVFGVRFPEDAEEAASILEEFIDTYQETLESIKF